MKTEKVRFGIIGVGGWARGVHIPNLKRIAGAEITALSSRSEQNLKAGVELCDRKPSTYSDYLALLESPDVDAVIICSPNHLHAPMSVAALERGKHVLCEKPMALSLADCNRVATAAEKAGRFYQLGLELRHSRFFTAARGLIREGRIGVPRMAWCAHHRGPTSKGKWRGQKAISGGPIFDVGVHYTDLFQLLLDACPARVSAEAVAFDGDGIWDCCEAIVTLENGVICNYRQTLLCRYGLDTGIYVLGSEGYLHANMSARRIVAASTRDREAQPLVMDLPDQGPVHGFDGSLQQLEAFTECIRSGKAPEVGVEIGQWSTRLCLGIETAIAEKRVVDLATLR